MPTVSVILPVRDGAAFLADALRSILGQSLADLDVVVIDDGSRDGSARLAEGFAARDRRLRVLRQARLGIVPALNAGLAATQAPFVARMDADDIALPGRLEKQLAALRRRPSLAALGTACRVFDPRNGHERTLRYPSAADAIRAELLVRNALVHPTVMMRREALPASGYRQAFAMCEDYDLWLRLAERHDLANLDEPLLRHRQHAGQTAWRMHERRILSELGCLACARLRRAGQPEPALPGQPIDRAFLARAGMNASDITAAVVSRALATAEDASAKGFAGAAAGALLVALRQPGLPVRERARIVRRAAGLMRRHAGPWRRG